MSDSNYNLLKGILDDIMARLDVLEKKLDALTKKAPEID